MNSAIVCPTDDKDDTIQKVSGISSAGTTRGSYSGPSGGVVYSEGNSSVFSGYTTLSGSSQTDLARLLSSPKKPGVSGYYLRLLLIFFLGLWSIAPLISLYGLLMFFLLGIPEMIGGNFGFALFLVGLMTMFVIFEIIFILLFRKVRGKRNRLIEESEALYLEQLPSWELAMSKWRRSYYCFRHDLVFDPDTSETSSPQEFDIFLYS